MALKTDDQEKLTALKHEVASFESRLTYTKAELESLRKQRDALKADIDADKVRHNADIEAKRALLRKESGELEEVRRIADANKKEVEGIIREFKKDREAVDNEMVTARMMKDEAQRVMDRANAFFVAVRNEANKL